jgi:dTDP-4-dehydrorhamnose 3,5-epimerase
MSSRFQVDTARIADLQVLTRKPIGDGRGYLERMYCAEDLRPYLSSSSVAQINHTVTVKAGTLRGMHFQYPPHAEIKIVSCIRGAVFDVAVDLRRNSPTFLEWHSEVLSADNHKTLLIPEGFAHGFQTLTEDCEMLYLHTAFYRADAEGGLNALDTRLSIQWPLPVSEQSARDASLPAIGDDFAGVTA